MIEIVSIETPAHGDCSYLTTDGQAALVVDPQGHIDRVLAIAAEQGARVTHVLETHIHNDYVSGESRPGAGHWGGLPRKWRR